MFETKKTLIVVYKDELLINQLKKLVETHDDTAEGIVGTRDDSINIIAWTEKVWLGNKKAGNIQGKILFLGDIKGTDKLIPVIDIAFDQYGVKYGWAGNQAVLFADVKALTDRKYYDAFLEELVQMPVPDSLKTLKDNTVNGVESKEDAPIAEDMQTHDENSGKKKTTLFRMAQGAVSAGAETLGKVGGQIAEKSEEVFRNKRLVKNQMMFYGVIKLYNDGLETFMNQ